MLLLIVGLIIIALIFFPITIYLFNLAVYIVGYTIAAIVLLIGLLVKLLIKLYKFLKPKALAQFKKLKEKYNIK